MTREEIIAKVEEVKEKTIDNNIEEKSNEQEKPAQEVKEEAKDDPNKYCVLCGKEKEDYEASMCDDCWEKEKARLSAIYGFFR